jgi:hypothetical protein
MRPSAEARRGGPQPKPSRKELTHTARQSRNPIFTTKKNRTFSGFVSFVLFVVKKFCQK